MILAALLSLSSEADACGMPSDYHMSLAALMEEVEAESEPIVIEPKTPSEAFELLAPPVENEPVEPPAPSHSSQPLT